MSLKYFSCQFTEKCEKDFSSSKRTKITDYILVRNENATCKN